jgi:hypothetical protein
LYSEHCILCIALYVFLYANYFMHGILFEHFIFAHRQTKQPTDMQTRK